MSTCDLAEDRGFKEISRLNGDWKPGAKYMNPDETRHTVVARLELGGEVPLLRLTPCRIDDDSVPRRVSVDSAEGQEVLAYLREITREAGLDTRYEVAGGEIVVRPEG